MSVFSRRTHLARHVAVALICAQALACTPRPFDRDLRAGNWIAAAQTFAADSSLMNDERALYDAAVLYGSPNRPTYDPLHARALLQRLLARFPRGKYSGPATDRLALMNVVIAARDSAAARERAVEARIIELTATVQRLRAGLDSVQAQNDGLRRSTSRLELDLRERDEQLRALRLELRQLKAIDLKPRRPP